MRQVSAAVRSVRTEVVEFLLFLRFLWIEFQQLCYNFTLPITRRLMSRVPSPPLVKVDDIRANRIRFDIQSSYSSWFNVEEFEVEWAQVDAAPNAWTPIGFSHIQQRTVARLKGDTTYRFRVRAQNERGTGGWCETLTVKTRQDPIDGGGHGPGYVWTQTASDVTISFELPKTTTKHDVIVKLKPDCLTVAVKKEERNDAIIDCELYGKVQTFDNGSFWELIREDGKLMLNVMLEKRIQSVAPKFDYWRSIAPGHPELEIDTHKLESPGQGMQQIKPGQMDPQQLRSMGLGHFASSTAS